MNSQDRYRQNTKRSAKMFDESCKYHVNGVSHNIRFFEPYPFAVKSAEGKSLIDIDENRYTDYWMGHWSLIFGHKPSKIRDRLHEQIDDGWMYGTTNQATNELSSMITSAVKVAEKIRYVTSGTEATMYATRLARSATGRNVIAKIDGGWHGYGSDLLKSVNWPYVESESRGMIGEPNIISIPYNDIPRSLEILQKYKNVLAGVIIEPVLGGGGCIPATKQYLRAMQEFVHNNDSLLILDEIVTGFRFRYGCLYPTMDLDPDIVTLGKIVGGGMPIGVLCGKKEIMNLADTSSHSKSNRAYIGGGTFSANPMSMTAGYATLKALKSLDIYTKINTLGKFARDELFKVFEGKVIVTGMGSLFMTHFVKNDTTNITNAVQVAQSDTEKLVQYHFKMIANDEIFFLPGKLGAISNEHTKSDIIDMIEASANLDI